MNQTIAKLGIIALVVSVTLTGCSTNTREQNTVLGVGTGAVAGGLLGTLATGAGAGWVIAAGAVVGGVIGGVIGNSVDSTDDTHLNTSLDKNSINEPSNWKNDKTGVWYEITPTSDVFAYKGSTYCRHYVAHGKTSHGKTFKAHGIACKNSNGMWEQVR